MDVGRHLNSVWRAWLFVMTLAGMALNAGSLSAQAVDPDPSQSSAVVEELVVTGSRVSEATVAIGTDPQTMQKRSPSR